MIELDNIATVRHYSAGQFPAKNLFLNNYYAVTNNYCYFKKECVADRKMSIYKCANEIFAKCEVAAFVDPTNEAFVLAYVLYTIDEDQPTLYFAYTKRSFRENKLFKTLLLEAGFNDKDMLKCRYIGRIPLFLRSRVIKERV